MVKCLHHRGPDGCGTDALKGALLGHSRLSIIDFSTGSQPMRDHTGKRCIVFNGEIYGYKEIRNATNHPYRTFSDTEVILALYEQYGTKMLDHIPGMFAFAIWDETEQRLFAARDRFGEKPLYYARTGNGDFIFASEIKAILASGLIEPKLSKSALAHYLNRLYVPVGQSIYSTIHQLLPAHALVYSYGKLTTWRYWEMPEVNDKIQLGDAVEEFQRLFTKAVHRQLVADVEVGAFLSGGLDSSSVVAIASKLHPGIRTFSFGFVDGPSEIKYARDVANRYHTNHLELEDSQENFALLVEKMADVYDEPFADSSAIPTYLISEFASRHLKVVLTGDGGDELLGGYTWYQYVHLHGELEKGSAAGTAVQFFFMHLWRRLTGGSPELHKKLRAFNRFRSGLTAGETHRRLRGFTGFKELKVAGFDVNLMEYQKGADAIDAATRTDLSDYLNGDILVKTDRASMAHGLELRAPFLDKDLAEFCLTLPSRMKINGRANKILLREAMKNRWPSSLLNRGKQGFAVSMHHWFKRPALSDLKYAYLSSPNLKIHSLLPSDLIRDISDRNDNSTWAILMLSVWLERKELNA